MLNFTAYNPSIFNQSAQQMVPGYVPSNNNPGSVVAPALNTLATQPGLLGGLSQLDNAIGNWQQPQNNNPMEMFMQLFSMMFQMVQQLSGMTSNPSGVSQNGIFPNNNSAQLNSPKAQPLPFTTGQQAQPNSLTNQTNTPAKQANTPENQGVTQDPNSPLSKVDPKELAHFKGKDLTATDSKGYPKYLVSKAKDGKYHIYAQNKDGDGKEYKSPMKLKQGSNKLHVKDPEANRKAASAASAAGSNGSTGTGGSSAAASASSTSSITYNPITGEITFTHNESASSASWNGDNGTSGDGYNDKPSGNPIENKGGGSTGSPLILDTNKDGKVSAEQGKGIDVNGDGKADGAATGGDKMLAMGDLDGDGQITGKEVFGNETVDPFTGQKLNAQNGFDALNMVAKSAEKSTGIKCSDEAGNVDMQKLKQALEMSGKGSLGLISDNNTASLEALGDAAKVNTTNYVNQQQTGDVQHNQLGSYTDTSGNTHKVDDVWFKLS
jgi:hypothetical protein